MTPLRVALGEYDTGWHDPESSLRAARGLVQRAAAAGARLVVQACRRAGSAARTARLQIESVALAPGAAPAQPEQVVA
ncbi:MAG TPA: hypothetical protein VHM30_05185, partial [Gemmatimonadaceae bacterium]|nr:hypothetical protein [Gemmatimonadaceae bacterium]